MSIKETHICDRCKKPFDINLAKIAGYFVKGIRKENHLHFHSTYDSNQGGYSYSDYRYDLCGDCTEKLIDFLNCKEK